MLAGMGNHVARNILLLMLAAAFGAALGAVTKFSLGHDLGTIGTVKAEPMKSAMSEP
jgi:hypothetical protein